MGQPDYNDMAELAAGLLERAHSNEVRDLLRPIVKGGVHRRLAVSSFRRAARLIVASDSGRYGAYWRNRLNAWAAQHGIKVAPGPPKVVRLDVALDREQHQVIRKAAEETGVSQAEFVRRHALLAAEQLMGE